MLFKRRDKPDIRERAQAWLWPKRGWKRAMDYVRHRVIRLSGSPHVVALGFAVGAFTSFTPFLGLHFIVAAVVALVVGGNVIASALGTFVGNPLTFPFIWLSTYSFGNFLLGIEAQDGGSPDMPEMSLWAGMSDLSSLLSEFWPLIKPMAVGGIPLGILVGAISYFLVKMIVTTYQEKRRTRLKRREEERRGERNRVEI